MPKITTYTWKAYSDGGLANPECQMSAYHNDPSHDPPQWQEDLEGLAKANAIQIVQNDRDEDEAEGFFEEHVMSAPERILQRKSMRTGNSWELALDADGWGLPDPCTGYIPKGGPWPVPGAPPSPEPIPETTLSNATVKVEKISTKRIRFTIEGNLPEA